MDCEGIEFIGMELAFSDITVTNRESTRVDKVSGIVSAGQVCAVVGLEDCGKDTLLYTLSGRVPMTSGQILIHCRHVNQSDLPRHVTLVTSEDTFLPTLTVSETLNYEGQLRLPNRLTDTERQDRIQEVEGMMGLIETSQDIVQFAPNIVRKSLNIACEMLAEVDVICIDEPFKNLSLNDSHHLMDNIRNVAKATGQGVMISFECPSSYLLQACSSVICLYKGKVVYRGSPKQLSSFLVGVGLKLPAGYSAIDYMLTLLRGDGMNDVHQESLDCLTQIQWPIPIIREQTGRGIQGYLPDERTKSEDACISREYDNLLVLGPRRLRQKNQKSFGNQLQVLVSRNFRNARRRILSPISLVQNLYITVICILVWWRPERSEETVKDSMGLFFFITVQWAFFALLDVLLTFPKEMRTVMKDCVRGLYGVPAFCLAKTLTEFPLALIQPAMFLCIIYWVANLNSLTAFLGSLLVISANVLAAQSLGLFLGTALTPPWTLMVVSLGLLSMMLWGGAFCTPPTWLKWGKFVSYFTYGLHGLVTLEFQHAEPIRCATASMVPVCGQFQESTNTTITHFPSDVILLAQGITWPLWANILVLLAIAMVTRVLWFIVLRRNV